MSWAKADVTYSELAPIFAGGDAVVHLAWAIQPSRDPTATERVNVLGSSRVFSAVAEAGVPVLIHASSVGAYSEGPKDRRVDERWPTKGIDTSAYSRHKAEVESMLDRFEANHSGVRVVRLRPGLIFKGEAASEIRRFFLSESHRVVSHDSAVLGVLGDHAATWQTVDSLCYSAGVLSTVAPRGWVPWLPRGKASECRGEVRAQRCRVGASSHSPLWRRLRS